MVALKGERRFERGVFITLTLKLGSLTLRFFSMQRVQARGGIAMFV
jgi:hypothetical protein